MADVPKRGRPKGSKDGPRKPGARPRGRPRKNAATTDITMEGSRSPREPINAGACLTLTLLLFFPYAIVLLIFAISRCRG